MNDLIKSLQIFCKYFDGIIDNPSGCEHDIFILSVADNQEVVSKEDQKELDTLGWFYDADDLGCWCSYRFGSC